MFRHSRFEMVSSCSSPTGYLERFPVGCTIFCDYVISFMHTPHVKYRNAVPPSGRYILFFFHDDYVFSPFGADDNYPLGGVNWLEKNDPNVCDDVSPYLGIKNFYLVKAPIQCRAPITGLTIQNEIGEWLPLKIQTKSTINQTLENDYLY